MKMTDAFRALAGVALTLAVAQASNSVPFAGMPSTAGLATDGGPDVWGYSYVDSDTTGSVPGKPDYNWIDIRGVGTRVTGLSDDNVVGPFQIGFVFPLYWQRYTEFFVGSNGYLAFDDDANSAHPFPDMPATQRPNNLIAPLMADLDFTGLTGDRGCWYWTNAACDTFVLQCESIPFWNVSGTWNSFEIILSKRDSAIAFQYEVQVGAPGGNSPGWQADNDVVGIENINGLTGLRYLYGATPTWNDLHSELAVRFFPPVASSYEFTDVWTKCAMSENSGGMFCYVAQPTYIWARFKNAGNQSLSDVPVSAEICQGNNPPIFQWSGTIPTMPVGYETTLTFGRCSLTTTADYTLKVKSGLSGDQYPANDSVVIEIRVVNYTFPTLLSYDVGYTGNVALNGFHGYAVKFIPPVYPIVIDTALFYFTGSQDPVTVLVYDDNGPRGSPGALLASVAWTPGVVGDWSNCYLGDSNISIRSGGFYLGYTKSQGGMYLGTDNTQPLSRQNWEYTGAWAPQRANEFFDLKIRTRIKQATAVDNVGVTEVLSPAGLLDSGQAVVPQARIKNFGSFPASPNVTFEIPGVPPYLQTAAVADLAPNRDTLVEFPVWSARPGFGLVPRCSVYVAGDAEPQNDTLSGAAFNVRYIDLGTVSVDRPRDTIEAGTAVAPKATVRNYGNTAENVVVRFSVPGTVYDQTQSAYLGVGVTDTVVFPVWTPPDGDYAGRCSTEHGRDMYSPNDSASARFFVRRRDAGALAILVPTGDSVPPGPVSPRATVHNYGNVASQIPAEFDIYKVNPGGDSLAYTSRDSAWVTAGSDATLAFPDQWTATGGDWRARLTTGLESDGNPVNDTMSAAFFVLEPSHDVDVGAVALLVPVGEYDTFDMITPCAIVRNFGPDLCGFLTSFWIADAGSNRVYQAETMLTLAPDAGLMVSFPVWPRPHALGNYTSHCSTSVNGDVVPGNDTLSRRFTVVPWKPALWTQMASVPTGMRGKNVKDGGCLARAQDPGNDTGLVYALKGNSTFEFYRYNIAANSWVARESIPAYNRLMKKKGVRKGASLVQSFNGKLYAAKGGGILDYWEYDPARPYGMRWTQKADIPYGARKLRQGSGAVAVRVNGADYIYFLKGSGTYEFYRYDSNSDVWETMAYAPSGRSGKPYKNGSCLTGDFGDTLFALKGSYNEFNAYSISGNNWLTCETMPRIAPPGTRKKKVKDGAGIAYQGRTVYGLKGGNTNEFWAYHCDERRWYLAPEMPLGGGTTKCVKGGGALAYARDGEARALYAFRGNNTLQFWQYGPLPPIDYPMSAARTQKSIQEQSSCGPQFSFSVSPNPFTNATVVTYSLPVPGNVNLRLYDITGKLVRTLAVGHRPAGEYGSQLTANGLRLAAGVYLLKFETDGYRTTRKLVIE